ncbi:AzlD domain-containing protein [uncultured Roseobacter sp.]|uniref:AzlD domain-containing protein n=1 Tax=uncultured Roseobacter sp. TaxID=114847 RepID=UPI00261F96EE|nr:AzlD domain-containing protein [uncultured Roseobacter sp.]
MNDQLAWLAIIVIASTVFALRYSGFALMKRVQITPKLELFLEKMSVSVLVAIVASSFATGGIRTITAVVIGLSVMMIWRSPIVAMLVGIAVAAIWTGVAS